MVPIVTALSGCGPRLIRGDGAADVDVCVVRTVALDDGATVDVVQRGRGRDVVRIPGAEDGMTLLRDRADEVCDQLAPRAAQVRTTVIARRHPLVDGDPARLADDVAATLDQIGLQDAVIVEGISAGGPVALHLALTHPDRVRALILATTFPALDDAGRVDAAHWSTWTKNGEYGALYRDMITRTAPPSLQALSFLTPLLAPPREPARFITLVDGLVAAAGPGARLETISVPTLVVTGESDRLISAALSARLLAIPGARLVVIPGHGHDATSTPDYERLVVDFVVTVGTGT